MVFEGEVEAGSLGVETGSFGIGEFLLNLSYKKGRTILVLGAAMPNVLHVVDWTEATMADVKTLIAVNIKEEKYED